jgi:hypothetical protein
MQFAQDRILLAEGLFKGLSERVVDKGEGYQRVRSAFSILLTQYGNAAYLVASHVGGEHAHRDHRGDPDGRDPFVPVKADKQREALKFLEQHILTDRPFQFPPELLRRLGSDRWMHWGNEMAAFSSVEFPVHARVLGIQRVALNHLFAPDVLSRVQNNALKADKGESPLTSAEVFRGVTDAVWCDCVKAADPKEAKEGKRKLPSSVVRRNLQREHLKVLSSLVLGKRAGAPADARSLARMHLRDIDRRIAAVLADKQVSASTTRAHLEECHEQIGKLLAASVQISEP